MAPQNELGRYLKSARERKNLTLRAVENVTGISNAYLSQLESGKIKNPSPNNLYKLSELYEVSYATVMQMAGYPVPRLKDDTDRALNFAARLGTVTEEEEDELLDYLEFLRTKHRRGTR